MVFTRLMTAAKAISSMLHASKETYKLHVCIFIRSVRLKRFNAVQCSVIKFKNDFCFLEQIKNRFEQWKMQNLLLIHQCIE